MAGCKSCSFRFLQIVRVSICHCQSPLSLCLCPSHPLSVLWALSLYSFTQRSLFHSSISSVSSLCYRSSLQISIALYRWLVICPGVIMNPSQDPDRRLPFPSVSPSLQTWPKTSHSSKFPDIWLFLANTAQLLCLENQNPYGLFKQATMSIHLVLHVCTHAHTAAHTTSTILGASFVIRFSGVAQCWNTEH